MIRWPCGLTSTRQQTCLSLASFVPAYNANGPVNAIPYVCAARPGLLTTEDLPPILPRGPRPAAAG